MKPCTWMLQQAQIAISFLNVFFSLYLFCCTLGQTFSGLVPVRGPYFKKHGYRKWKNTLILLFGKPHSLPTYFWPLEIPVNKFICTWIKSVFPWIFFLGMLGLKITAMVSPLPTAPLHKILMLSGFGKKEKIHLHFMLLGMITQIS